MMKQYRTVSENQLAVTGLVLMLSPALRLFPSAAADAAGRSAPFAALLAFSPPGSISFSPSAPARCGGRGRICAR